MICYSNDVKLFGKRLNFHQNLKWKLKDLKYSLVVLISCCFDMECRVLYSVKTFRKQNRISVYFSSAWDIHRTVISNFS